VSILIETSFPYLHPYRIVLKSLQKIHIFNSKHIRKCPACVSQPCSFRPPEASDYLEKQYEQEQVTRKSLLDKNIEK